MSYSTNNFRRYQIANIFDCPKRFDFLLVLTVAAAVDKNKMAPNPQSQTLVVVQPVSNLQQVEKNPISVEKTSRIMRCSSVSYSEEESLVLDCRSEAEFVRSLRSLKKTSCVLSSFAETLDSKWWPGVSCGLDEDDRQGKVKQSVTLEPEEKKEAVENDDKSSGFCWQTRDTAEEKKLEYTLESTIREAKHVKASTLLVNLASGK